MQTQPHIRSKSSYHPSLAAAKPAVAKPALQVRPPARPKVPQFRIIKSYEGFRLNQVVHQYTGPTHDVDVPGEVNVTVVPGTGPFVGLPPDHLERIG
jgi:hypothetical protein